MLVKLLLQALKDTPEELEACIRFGEQEYYTLDIFEEYDPVMKKHVLVIEDSNYVERETKTSS